MKRSTTLFSTVVAIVVMLEPFQAFAFSSFEIYGGAYHQKITEEALSRFNFRDEPLKYLNQGLLEPDKFYRKKFTNPEHHFTEEDFPASLTHLRDRYRQIVQDAGSSVDDYECYRRTLFTFGEYLHSTQDFYAHTNWVEISLARGLPETPLYSFDQTQTQLVTSPYFLYKSLPPKELTDQKTYEKEFGLEFYSEPELENLTAPERIRLATAPERAFTHHALAKDNPDYPQSSLRLRPGAPTLFDFAYDAAVRDTRFRWNSLTESIWESYPEQGSEIISLFRNGWASDLPDLKATPNFETTEVFIEVDEDLELTARFILKPTNWSRQAGNSVVELFTLLVSDQVAADSQYDKLELRKNRVDQQFEIELETDLVGGAESFLLMTPVDREKLEGDWTLKVSLPPGWSRNTRIEVKGPDGEAGQDGTNYRLSPPAGGWELPEWIESYVEDPKS